MATNPETRTVQGLQAPATGTFKLDKAHTHVGFVVRHMMVAKVKGRFAEFEGKIVIGDDPLDSEVDVTIEAKSIDTRDEGRDTHLRSADFFDVENFPALSFKAKGVSPIGKGTFELPGELTIHGVTRPVTLSVEHEGIVTDPYGNERIGFSASTEIDREDFGLTWNAALETGGVVVSKSVKIELEVEAIREA